MENDVPVRELDIVKIAKYCIEQIPYQEPREREMIQELIDGLFDSERERVHMAIRSLGIMLCNPDLK